MVLKSVSVNDAERARNSVCMDSLKTWILSEGGKVQKVKTCTTSPRRFVAAEQINGSDSNGQPIFSIPISCLMHPALAKSDPKYGSTLTKLANEHGVDDRTILTLPRFGKRSRRHVAIGYVHSNTTRDNFDTIELDTG